jgi:hypothetical protein
MYNNTKVGMPRIKIIQTNIFPILRFSSNSENKMSGLFLICQYFLTIWRIKVNKK